MPDILLHQFLLNPQTGRFLELGRVRSGMDLGQVRLKLVQIVSFEEIEIFELILRRVQFLSRSYLNYLKLRHQVALSIFSMVTRWRYNDAGRLKWIISYLYNWLLIYISTWKWLQYLYVNIVHNNMYKFVSTCFLSKYRCSIGVVFVWYPQYFYFIGWRYPTSWYLCSVWWSGWCSMWCS